MKVEKDGKTLYHVQSITDWHEDAYDMFVYASSESELRDLIDNSNIYTLYAETI